MPLKIWDSLIEEGETDIGPGSWASLPRTRSYSLCNTSLPSLLEHTCCCPGRVSLCNQRVKFLPITLNIRLSFVLLFCKFKQIVSFLNALWRSTKLYTLSNLAVILYSSIVKMILYYSRLYQKSSCLCYSRMHSNLSLLCQEIQPISPSPWNWESVLIVLMNKMQWKWCCISSENRSQVVRVSTWQCLFWDVWPWTQ